mgnify:CR=1 FL=1|jgi:acylphosphatase
MKKQLHLIISGRVQGVFFRDNTKKKAQSLGLTGYVKNNSDGTVEIVAEGNESKLKQLLEFCKQGPEAADVNNTKIEWQECQNQFKTFTINTP